MEEEQQIVSDWKSELFVGKNYYYYKNKWQGKPEHQSFTSWNWAAFIFPVYWLAYRKMYLEAFLYGLIALVVWIIPGGGLIAGMFAGIYANFYYRKKALKVIGETSGMMDDEARQYINKRGGTSVPGVFVTGGITVFLAISVIAGLVLFSSGEEKNYLRIGEPNTFTVYDVSVTFPDGWKETKEETPYDLECFSRSEDSGTGIFIYEAADVGEGEGPEAILEMQIDYIESQTKNFTLVEELKDEEVEGKRIRTVVYSGENTLRLYYIFSLVEFEESDKFVFVLQTSLPSSYNREKSTLAWIVSTCTLNQENDS